MSLKLNGIFPPITTPFDHNGNIYATEVQHNVEKWNRTTLSGYVVMGSTGESVMLTTDEKISLWEQVAKWAAPEKLLIAGTGMESVRETVCLTNRAAEMGYKAAMVRTPHYYKNLVNRADAQMLYYRAVADQSKIPLIIYNGRRPPASISPWKRSSPSPSILMSSPSRKAPAALKRLCR